MLIAVEQNALLTFYDMNTKIWQTFGETVPINEPCRAVTSFGINIYVGGDRTVYRCSIDSDTWDVFPAMRISKGGRYQLIVLGEYLYAIGNNPERYSFREKTWQQIASATNRDYTAAVLDGCIYAVGQTNTLLFDESRNQWIQKSNNLSDRRSCCRFGYKGKLVIKGGQFLENRVLNNSKTVEVYCNETDRWSEVLQKPGLLEFAF